MEPTLPIGTRIIVERRKPAVGEIVVVHPPAGFEMGECGPKRRVLKDGGAACDVSVPREAKFVTVRRIVAGPGDQIYVRAGHVYRRTPTSRRFVREPDPYTRPCGHGRRARMCNLPVPITIPAGHWFMMGDNRGASEDSRSWGPVPRRWIVGVATRLECLSAGRHRMRWVRRSARRGCSGPRGHIGRR